MIAEGGVPVGTSGDRPSHLAPAPTVPRTHVPVTARHRLVGLLDDAVGDHRLAVVVGGAGTGKTLAVMDWVEHGRHPSPVVWVTVQPGLRPPTRFWSALRAAIRAVLDEEWLEDVVLPSCVDDEFVEAFAGALAGSRMQIVLDDAQVLGEGDVWSGLDRFVTLMPPGIQLVVVSRTAPPLSLHRLRLAGELGEIGGATLSFTVPEARQLLLEYGVQLSDEAFAHLMAATEGWAAGLRMALISIARAGDPDRVAQQFGGEAGLVVDYVMDEILQGLGPASAELLRQTSVTDLTCGPLAQALTGDQTAPTELMVAARRTGFIIELERRGWYRYHPLMLQTLRRQLHGQDPALEKELHRRAALWLEEEEEWLEALEHAIASQDRDLVSLITLRSAVYVFSTSERSRLGALLDSIPTPVTHDRADLQVIRALAAYCRDERLGALDHLARAEPGLSALTEPSRSLATLTMWILRAGVARRTANVPAMVEAGRRAGEIQARLSAEVAPGWALMGGISDTLTGIGELFSGRPRRARELMTKGMSQVHSSDVDHFGTVWYEGHYALVEQALGQVRAARDLATKAIETAGQTGSTLRPEARPAYLALAATETSRGDAAAAGAALDAASAITTGGEDRYVSTGLREVAVRRDLLLGDLRSARRELAALRRMAGLAPDAPFDSPDRVALEVEVRLTAGAVAEAAATLDRYDAMVPRLEEHHPGEPEPLVLARARVALARGGADRVRTILAWQLSLTGELGADAWVVVALAEHRCGREVAANEALGLAIDLAAPEEARFPFLRPRDDLDRLLRHQHEVGGAHRTFIAEVLQARAGSGPSRGPFDPLTERELSVLVHLSSLSSNEEIANSLGISVNTVKQHLKSVNRKLGVTSRRDAYRVASALGLLSGIPNA